MINHLPKTFVKHTLQLANHVSWPHHNSGTYREFFVGTVAGDDICGEGMIQNFTVDVSILHQDVSSVRSLSSQEVPYTRISCKMTNIQKPPRKHVPRPSRKHVPRNRCTAKNLSKRQAWYLHRTLTKSCRLERFWLIQLIWMFASMVLVLFWAEGECFKELCKWHQGEALEMTKRNGWLKRPKA